MDFCHHERRNLHLQNLGSSSLYVLAVARTTAEIGTGKGLPGYSSHHLLKSCQICICFVTIVGTQIQGSKLA